MVGAYASRHLGLCVSKQEHLEDAFFVRHDIKMPPDSHASFGMASEPMFPYPFRLVLPITASGRLPSRPAAPGYGGLDRLREYSSMGQSRGQIWPVSAVELLKYESRSSRRALQAKHSSVSR
jgi:hypothetical protein